MIFFKKTKQSDFCCALARSTRQTRDTAKRYGFEPFDWVRPFTQLQFDPTPLPGAPFWFLVSTLVAYGLFLLANFVMDKSDIPLIKFNGKNYTSWAFQFQIHLKSKEMWGHVDGSDPNPHPIPNPQMWKTMRRTWTNGKSRMHKSWAGSWELLSPNSFCHFVHTILLRIRGTILNKFINRRTQLGDFNRNMRSLSILMGIWQ